MAFTDTHSSWGTLTARSAFVYGAGHNDFPMLITEAWLSVGQRAALFSAARSDGADIRFALDESGIVALSFELVAWNSTAQTFIVWVRIPFLSATNDTTIYYFVGDPDASLPAASAANGRASVWADYDAVYHGQSLTNAASATGVGDLTAVGSPQFNQSPITTGGRFQISAGNYYESVGYTPLLGPGDKTICAAIDLAASPPASARGILNIGPNTTAGGRLTYFVQAATGYLALAVRSDTILSSSAVPAQVRTAFVYDGSESVNASLYTDGSVHTSDTLNDVDTLVGSEFRLGRQQSTLDFDGFLNELWLRPSAVSGDWLATEHANQSNPGAFGFAGDMQSVGGGEVDVSLLDATSLSALDSISLAQFHNLTAFNLTSVSALAATSLGQQVNVSVQSLASATVIDDVLLSVAGVIQVASLHSTTAVQIINITQAHDLWPQSLVSEAELDAANLVFGSVTNSTFRILRVPK